MQSIFIQIQAIINTYFPDKTHPLSPELRLTLLQKILPLCDQIPHPASGHTLERWQILAWIASIDLTLVKWLESHLDAMSILQELGYSDCSQQSSNKLWSVWASEGQAIPLRFTPNHANNDRVTGVCHGTKTWCSAASLSDFGLLTYRDDNHHAQLVIVDMHQNADTITINNQQWQAVGMQATDTATITFAHSLGYQVGTANAYLERAGFWHGAGGVAACWYGATVAIATYLHQAYQSKPHPFKAMYLGQISSQLAVTQGYFYHVATQIDRDPNDSHELTIRQLRQQVEATARLVIEQVGQALGATPFCQNAHFARLTADLGVFIRQSHGAFDAQAIGELVGKIDSKEAHLWQL